MKPLITSDGFFAYRTKALTYENAIAFAACLRANSSRFTSVDVKHGTGYSSQTKRWIVTFQPVNPDRMADIGDRENAARIQRADREGGEYLYMLDVDSPRPFYRVYNPKSGETYELDSSSCSCPDFRYRCDRASGFGLKYKHIHEMTRRFDCGELVRLADCYDTPEWRRAHPPVFGIREYHPATVAAMAAGG